MNLVLAFAGICAVYTMQQASAQELKFPRQVAFFPESHTKVLVANYASSQIDICETSNCVPKRFFTTGADPWGLCVTGKQIVVTEQGTGKILVLSKRGNVISTFGPQLSGIEGKLNRPQAACLNQDGDLFIADTGNHRIVKIEKRRPNKASVLISSNEKLSAPADLKMLAGDRMLVADTAHNRVIVFKSEKIEKIIGPSIRLDDRMQDLSKPYAVSSFPGRTDQFLIADTFNNRIVLFDLKSNSGRTISVKKPLQKPEGVTVSSTGDLVISNTFANQILVHKKIDQEANLK